MELRTAECNKHLEVAVLDFYIMSVKRGIGIGERAGSAIKTNKRSKKEQFIGTKHPGLECQQSGNKMRKAKHSDK